MSLVFYEKSHRYRLDGKLIPGVTTLIKGGLPAPQLMYWSAKQVAQFVADNEHLVDEMRALGPNGMVGALKEVPWTHRDKLAVRGTEVHDYAEKLVMGQAVDVPEHLTGYVRACVDFLNDWNVEPIVVEKPVANRAAWYAGKPDLIGRLPDGTVALFDWKSGTGVYPEAALQLAAYRNAEFYAPEPDVEEPMPEIGFTAAVHLQEDGYSVRPLETGPAVFQFFRHVAYVADKAKQSKSLVLDEIAGPEAVA